MNTVTAHYAQLLASIYPWMAGGVKALELGAADLRISHYPKLRLSPDVVVGSLEKHGLNVMRTQAPRGMVQIVAVRQ